MAGSTIGEIFRVNTYGESHGIAVGAVIDGCPSGVFFDIDFIQKELDRRKPGLSGFSSARKENDKLEVVSGVFDGITTGTPISLSIRNYDHNSSDYSHIKDIYRPSHADLSYDLKYGFRDYRGGGRASGRETVARVAAGAVAKLVLREIGVNVNAYTSSIGKIKIDEENIDFEFCKSNSLCMPDKLAYEQSKRYIESAKENGDSVGGVVTCVVTGMKAGIGEPVFKKLDGVISQAVMSIGGAKAIEFGSGFLSSQKTGFENNDGLFFDGEIKKSSNNSGGVVGGISDGDKVIFKTYFKPTPSISRTQTTVNTNNENIEININGRHDPIIVPRAVVVVEAMASIILVDYIFQNMLSKISSIKNFHQNLSNV